MSETTVSASDWIKGISLSILASMIGGASKLAIRKSWLLQQRWEDEIENHLHAGDSLLRIRSIASLAESSDSEDGLEDDEENSRTLAVVANEIDSTDSVTYNDEARLRYENAGLEMMEAIRKKQRYLAYTLRGSGMFGMTCLNPLCCVLAMNYASPSILAPFSGLTLVWIVLLSRPLIRESPSRRQVVAAVFIIVGEVVVAVFGDHKNDEGVTVADVRQSYLEVSFMLYFGGTVLLMLLLVHWMRSGSPILKRFAWGVSGGIITGLQNFLKDSLTLIKAVKISDTEESYPWFGFLLIVLAVSTSFGGLLLLTACMKRFDATYSSAMFVGSFVVSASIMSAIHYNTFSQLQSLANLILYPAGLLILMAGVLILVQESRKHSDPGDRATIVLEDPATPRQRNGPVRLVSYQRMRNW
jgi:drug/metabolite transporter (DMT)-like permease